MRFTDNGIDHEDEDDVKCQEIINLIPKSVADLIKASLIIFPLTTREWILVTILTCTESSHYIGRCHHHTNIRPTIFSDQFSYMSGATVYLPPPPIVGMRDIELAVIIGIPKE